ncbi:protein of unknown function [Methylocella tundrae]|uniref:Uncharacterized protein n=1 Tax=Methylocella tundrae TaxID=227605 RepID=A0A4U8Z1H2_METTU|nr:protein of unknown function [Methylocella tundrae]
MPAGRQCHNVGYVSPRDCSRANDWVFPADGQNIITIAPRREPGEAAAWRTRGLPFP